MQEKASAFWKVRDIPMSRILKNKLVKMNRNNSKRWISLQIIQIWVQAKNRKTVVILIPLSSNGGSNNNIRKRWRMRLNLKIWGKQRPSTSLAHMRKKRKRCLRRRSRLTLSKRSTRKLRHHMVSIFQYTQICGLGTRMDWRGKLKMVRCRKFLMRSNHT